MYIVDPGQGELVHAEDGVGAAGPREAGVGDPKQLQHLHHPRQRDLQHRVDPLPPQHPRAQPRGQPHYGVYLHTPVYVPHYRGPPQY